MVPLNLNYLFLLKEMGVVAGEKITISDFSFLRVTGLETIYTYREKIKIYVKFIFIYVYVCMHVCIKQKS